MLYVQGRKPRQNRRDSAVKSWLVFSLSHWERAGVRVSGKYKIAPLVGVAIANLRAGQFLKIHRTASLVKTSDFDYHLPESSIAQ